MVGSAQGDPAVVHDDVPSFVTARPRLRARDVVTTIRDLAIVSFDVDPDALRVHLPASIEPDVFALDDGRRRAFISAVSLTDFDFRFGFAPFLRMTFPQVNYRAYVQRAGKRAVWFFATTLASRLAVVPRRLWQLPWYRVPTTLEAEWDGERCVKYALTAGPGWGPAEVRITGTDEPLGRLDGFADVDETRLVLTHPLDGYFARRGGGVGIFSVWHDAMRLRVGHASVARYGAFERLGLVEPSATPHSVLLQRAIEFTVLLPPRIAM